ncbi:MAG: hypothetical protein AAGI11_22055 [Pseudomonadota bacterium]
MSNAQGKQAVKSLTAGSAVVSGSTLPEHFSRPVSEAGLASAKSPGSTDRQGYATRSPVDESRGYGDA